MKIVITSDSGDVIASASTLDQCIELMAAMIENNRARYRQMDAELTALSLLSDLPDGTPDHRRAYVTGWRDCFARAEAIFR